MSHWVKAVLVGDDGDMAAMCIWVLFNGPFSLTSRVSQYQKGKTIWILLKRETVASAGYMQVCTSLQTDDHANTPQLKFFTGQMPFLLPN